MEQPVQNPSTPQDPVEVPKPEAPPQPTTPPTDPSPQWTNFKKKLDAFLERSAIVSLTTIITIYALFNDDIRQLVDDRDADYYFYIITSVVLAFFVLEIVISCLAKPDYFLGFFFWLDMLSTFTIIFDIGWVSDAMFGIDGNSPGAIGAAKLERASRASRVNDRAARFVKIIRLVRLVRIVKLYKAAQATLARRQAMQRFEESAEEMVVDDTTTYGKIITLAPVKMGQAITQKEVNGSKESFNELPVRKDSFGELPSNRKPSVENVDLPKSGSEEMGPVRKESAADLAMMNNLRDEDRKDSDILAKRSSIDRLSIKKSTVGPSETKSFFTRGFTQKKKRKQNPQEALPQETNVGKKLSDLTTRRVITLVMSVMISIPVFSTDTYVQDFTSGESGLRSLFAMNQSGSVNAYQLALQNYISAHTDIRNPLVALNVLGDYIPISDTNEDLLRDAERQYYSIEGDNEDEADAYSVFDLRDDTHLNAILGIIRTFFVTGVLTAAAFIFSKDSNDLVLFPIETMLVKVKRITENPLAAAQIEEEDALYIENLEREGKMKQVKKKKDEGNYETSILEKTILKLGALLALGFGEAGSDIIAQNMSKNGDVDPMIPGKKVMAIFGFCDIRQFTDATEVLQEGVMVFVNEIAEIVHSTINDFSGAANKNIGDAFLLVWKFPEEEVEKDNDVAGSSNLKLKTSITVNQLADMAVISFLKVMAGINKSKKLEKYQHNENLNRRIKNFSVKMGFGLHVGWAIEGAIGSEFKIDASYLSPNVNVAARLEAATKQFGVPILISGALRDICSMETQRNLRRIDRVTVKGSIQPIDLYTCDVDFSKLTINQNEVDLSAKTATEKKQYRVETRMRKEELQEKAFSGKVKIAKKFQNDKDVATMRKPFTPEFEDEFREGMENYIAGNWGKARDLFENTLKMLPGREKDGPSNTLLTYMSEFGYRAPHDWKGYRELTEK